MESPLSSPPTSPPPQRKKPLSSRNAGPSTGRLVQLSYEAESGDIKVDHDSGNTAVDENTNPKEKFECVCGTTIRPAGLEEHLKTHKNINPGYQESVSFTRQPWLDQHIRNPPQKCKDTRLTTSTTKRIKKVSKGITKTKARSKAVVRKERARRVNPKISRTKPSTPSQRPQDLSVPPVNEASRIEVVATAQSPDQSARRSVPEWITSTSGNANDDEDDDDDDDDVRQDDYDYEAEAEDDAATPTPLLIEPADLLPPIVDASTDPTILASLLDCDIYEDDEPFNPLFFNTGDVALMTNPYYTSDAYISLGYE